MCSSNNSSSSSIISEQPRPTPVTVTGVEETVEATAVDDTVSIDMTERDKESAVLLITANLGSIFDDPCETLKLWMKEFLSNISRLKPQFIAIHCQEVGGKHYETSMSHVDTFVKGLINSHELKQYNRARIFLDEDFKQANKFTALGIIILIHDSLRNVFIWDFEANKFKAVTGKQVHTGSLENVMVQEKLKFPQEFFPECKWSRKGFIRTRWCINNSIFDLINVHLFHDESNLIAMQSCPSVYSSRRKQALNHIIKTFEEDKYEKFPFFLFGDFNFRLDTLSVVESLCAKAIPDYSRINGSITRVVFRHENNEQEVLLTLEKKSFLVPDETIFNNNEWLQFDIEPKIFKGKITEIGIEFPPSYPYSEDISQCRSFMKTRCPSWCDRIMFSPSAYEFIAQDKAVEYNIMGLDVCMGDHKPVYLLFTLLPGKGKQELGPISYMHVSCDECCIVQ